MVKRLLIFLMLILTNCCLAVTTAATPHKLRVGVETLMPFAQNIDGHYSGIAIDIWENIATTNHWDYTYIPVSYNENAELKRLSPSGDLDVMIGSIAVNSRRLQIVDFSRPFYLSTVTVITKKHDLNILDVFRTFFSKVLFVSVLMLILSFVIFIHILWLCERKKSEANPHGGYAGFSKGMWENLFKKGLSMPTTLAGRLLTLVWIMFAAALITSINANYTAAMTVSLGQSNSKITSIEDLHSVKVIGVEGRGPIEVAEQNGIDVQKIPTIDEAAKLLINGDADALVSDAILGKEYLRTHGIKDFVVSSLVISNSEKAFAVKLNSPLRHQIDLGVARMHDNGSAILICRRYIGDEARRCDL